MTAQDVLFSYEILRDEGLPSFRASLPLTIADAEVLDDRRIRFNFNPDAPLRDRVQSAGGLPVFSEASHIASGLAFEDSRLEPLIGSGPYVLGEVDPGNRVVYTRNRDYWGDDLWITKVRNNFDTHPHRILRRQLGRVRGLHCRKLHVPAGKQLSGLGQQL